MKLRLILFSALCLRLIHGAEPALEKELAGSSQSALKQYCFDCHNDKKTKGHVNLQQMTASPDFAGLFKSWEKVIEMLEQKKMPPEEKPQPTDAERQKLITAIRHALDSYIRREAGDPGRIAMRQLTSAEYAYTIQDLTGLELGLEKSFVSDAVGGEGFSNVGDVQFIQDSTLERYLEAAKIVSTHAIIAAGPVKFGTNPGKTGQELAAIRRIQEIYRQHGFRTAAGEGGLAYGLDRYPKAFYAAWRFQNRSDLGNSTLAQCAQGEGIDLRFLEHIWKELNEPALSFPSAEIAAAWRKLPGAKQPERARAESEKIYNLIREWQLALAENPGNAEDAPILTETSFKPSLTKAFRIRLAWPAGTTNAAFQISAAPFPANGNNAKPAILWQAGLRFRQGPAAAAAAGFRNRQPPKPLSQFVSDETAQRLNFGRAPNGNAIGTNDFITLGPTEWAIQFAIPTNMTQAELVIEARLDLAHGDDCVARCVISHELNEGATVAAIGTFSAILSNPSGPQTETLRAGVVQFARNFPQISHREPNPADRDPIPAPYDNDYNNAERNDFHAFIKYHRDDRFLTEHILDDATRAQLDQAWSDLLTSFDYHNTFLRFVAKKFTLNLTNITELTKEQIDALPSEPKQYVKWLYDDFTTAQRNLQSAQSGHLRDALHFAQLAWRRPLTQSETERLNSFYKNLRDQGAEHPDALRSLLARILVSPAFLYRTESPNRSVATTDKRIPLSDHELASRLSYFLWSSVPDVELSRAATAGELKKPEQLAAQAKRMLHDPRARRFATEFFGQWFGFYRFNEYRGVDTTRFPEFTDNLKTDLYNEAVSFFDHIVREDRPIQEILFADYSFLNRNLAAHYQIDAPAVTNQLAKIAGVNQFHRGGLLRLGAPLITTSAPLRTSGVKRGDWILRRVLGKATPPPPGDAGSIPPDDVLSDGKTVRQRLEAHRTDPSCVNCHSRIDPLGFALEHFDSLGRWRETYRDGQKIDASGTLNDGTEIAELEGLLQYLKTHQTHFDRTLCAKLLGYALGRAEQISDRPLLDHMTAGLQKDPRFSTLITQIVASPQFRFQRAESPKQTAAK